MWVKYNGIESLTSIQSVFGDTRVETASFGDKGMIPRGSVNTVHHWLDYIE